MNKLVCRAACWSSVAAKQINSFFFLPDIWFEIAIKSPCVWQTIKTWRPPTLPRPSSSNPAGTRETVAELFVRTHLLLINPLRLMFMLRLLLLWHTEEEKKNKTVTCKWIQSWSCQPDNRPVSTISEKFPLLLLDKHDGQWESSENILLLLVEEEEDEPEYLMGNKL